MPLSPYTLRLADGVPMAFPADHTLDAIRESAQAYANGEHGAARGVVWILRDGWIAEEVGPITTKEN